MDLDKNFSVLRDKILKINKDYKELSKEYKELQEKYDLLRGKYEEEQRENQELKEEQKKIKLISAISGNPDHNRLMKNHINRLNKQDRNIRTWKNKEGNLCFSYDMRDPMENPTIIIIILLVFIGIILFEYLCLNSYHSMIILSFCFFFIFKARC